ncbi:MAG: sulfatase [Gemmatimonadaceae bacterium]
MPSVDLQDSTRASTNAPSASLTRGRLVSLGVWAGFVSGLAEGVAHAIARGVPTIQSPYKVSLDVVWIAPLVNAVLFGVIAVALWIVALPFRRRLGARVDAALVGVLLFGGVAVPALTLKVLYLPSAVLLALGAAVVITRANAPRLIAASSTMSRRAVMLPIAVCCLALAIKGVVRLKERRVIGALPTVAQGARNVVILVLDTVRRDRFAHADGSSLTPNIDRFASQGTWYANAWSTTSWSLPSQASILTGQHPFAHGADWPGIGMKAAVSTLPEFLAARGYATGAFSGNVAWIVPEHLGRGFARFEAYRPIDIIRRIAAYRVAQPVIEALGYRDSGYGKQAPQVREQLLDFVDGHRDRPFFAYVCLMDVNQSFHRRKLSHPAWTPEPPARDIMAAYDSALRQVDVEVNTIFEALRSRGVLDNTVVVIVSDHGESFGAEQTDDHNPIGHGTSLYPEQTRVPMWVILPPGERAAATIEQPVSIRAIAATITRSLALPDSGVFGAPLPVVRAGDAAPARDSAATALLTLRYAGRHDDAIVRAPFFLFRKGSETGKPTEFYDLAADPLAKRPLPADARSSALAALMDAQLPPPTGKP